MNIRTERGAIAGVPVLKVFGNLDFDTSGRLLMWADEAWDPQKKLLILDLQGVDHIDSAGVTELVLIKKRARRQGGNVVHVDPVHDLVVVWRWSAQSQQGFKKVVEAITDQSTQ